MYSKVSEVYKPQTSAGRILNMHVNVMVIVLFQSQCVGVQCRHWLVSSNKLLYFVSSFSFRDICPEAVSLTQCSPSLILSFLILQRSTPRRTPSNKKKSSYFDLSFKPCCPYCVCFLKDTNESWKELYFNRLWCVCCSVTSARPAGLQVHPDLPHPRCSQTHPDQTGPAGVWITGGPQEKGKIPTI